MSLSQRSSALQASGFLDDEQVSTVSTSITPPPSPSSTGSDKSPPDSPLSTLTGGQKTQETKVIIPYLKFDPSQPLAPRAALELLNAILNFSKCFSKDKGATTSIIDPCMTELVKIGHLAGTQDRVKEKLYFDMFVALASKDLFPSGAKDYLHDKKIDTTRVSQLAGFALNNGNLKLSGTNVTSFINKDAIDKYIQTRFEPQYQEILFPLLEFTYDLVKYSFAPYELFEQISQYNKKMEKSTALDIEVSISFAISQVERFIRSLEATKGKADDLGELSSLKDQVNTKLLLIRRAIIDTKKREQEHQLENAKKMCAEQKQLLETTEKELAVVRESLADTTLELHRITKAHASEMAKQRAHHAAEKKELNATITAQKTELETTIARHQQEQLALTARLEQLTATIAHNQEEQQALTARIDSQRDQIAASEAQLKAESARHADVETALRAELATQTASVAEAKRQHEQDDKAHTEFKASTAAKIERLTQENRCVSDQLATQVSANTALQEEKKPNQTSPWKYVAAGIVLGLAIAATATGVGALLGVLVIPALIAQIMLYSGAGVLLSTAGYGAKKTFNSCSLFGNYQPAKTTDDDELTRSNTQRHVN